MKQDKDKNNDKLSRSRQIKIDVEKEREFNPYYLKVSKRYRVLKFASLGILLFYLIGMLGLHANQITYENLVYLMKDLDTDVEAEGGEFKEIKYDESLKMSAALYKGRLAAATTNSFTLYNTAGSVERSYSISMENPKVLTGDKYALVYDVGGTSYSLYTSIVQVLSKQTEYALQGAALSESGTFALISRARENRYLVTVYDANFREVSRIYKDKYVMDVSLSADGERYTVVSCDVSGSDVATEVMCGRCDSDTSVTSTFSGTMPIETAYFSDGTSCVVCDNAVIFYNKNGEVASKNNCEGYGLLGVSFSKSHVMTVESDNIVESRITLNVFSSAGERVVTRSENAKISACALGDTAAFITFDGKLMKIGLDGTEAVTECALTVSSLVPFSDNVIVLEPTRASTGFASPEEGKTETQGKETG